MVQQAKGGRKKIGITGMGMVTPVGGSVEQTCASLRASISRVAASEDLKVRNQKGHKSPVVCGFIAGVTDGQRRFLRLFRMASLATKEALAHAAIAADGLRNCGLYLGLAEQDRPGLDTRAANDLPQYLGHSLGAAGLEGRSEVFTCGHASIFYAVRKALIDLESGKCRQALVGCVDTYLDELTLTWLFKTNRLKTAETHKGFFPGEGAAFFVLEDESEAKRRKVDLIARIGGIAIAIEPNTIYSEKPCKGEGLTTCVNQTLASVQGGFSKPGLTLSDLNGERYRALEWGLVVSRVPLPLESGANVWHPADCMGDAGSATGAINVCVATVAMRKGYANSPSALVWGSSDYGDRGSCIVQQN